MASKIVPLEFNGQPISQLTEAQQIRLLSVTNKTAGWNCYKSRMKKAGKVADERLYVLYGYTKHKETLSS